MTLREFLEAEIKEDALTLLPSALDPGGPFGAASGPAGAAAIPAPDPNLPDIVYIHGILGGHLIDVASGARVWVELLPALAGHLDDALEFRPAEANGNFRLRGGGHLRTVYSLAEGIWRAKGFNVRQFNYDWRRGVDELAAEFVQFVKSNFPGGKRFAIVAHSMGGVVAAQAANLDRDLARQVDHAVFAGVPLRGSLTPMDAISGENWMLQLIAKLSVPSHIPIFGQPELPGLRRMAAGLPGLVDLLADPDLFHNAAQLYDDSGVWPDGIAPTRERLQRSRQLKKEQSASPLLEKAAALVTRWIKAPIGVERQAGKLKAVDPVEGDGEVPVQSAIVGGMKSYELEYVHPLDPLDPLFIEAAAQLVQGQEPGGGVRRFTPGDASQPSSCPLFSEAEAVLELNRELIGSLVHSVRVGALDQDLLLWILSHGRYKGAVATAGH